MENLETVIRPGTTRGLDFVTLEELRKRTGVNPDEVLKFERVDPGFNDKCVMCGFEGPMDYQTTYHNGKWGLLCGRCGLKLAEKLGKVE